MKPEQERVRHLLTDTVSLLCKNGLQFQDELKVEGLIGITVDNSEVFIVHINEAFGPGGVQKSPPKTLGSGPVHATVLSDLPGMTVGNRGRIVPRGTMRNARTFRGRPYTSAVRRGSAALQRRLPLKQQMSRSRGTVNTVQDKGAVIAPDPSDTYVHSLPSSPPHIVKTETDEDAMVVVQGNIPSSSTVSVPSTDSPTKNQDLPQSITSKEYGNLGLDDIAHGSIPFFDPMNDSVDSQTCEPNAKQDSESLETDSSALSPLISSNSAAITTSTSLSQPQSSSNWTTSTSTESSLQVKQETPEDVQALPPSLQPMGNTLSWPMDVDAHKNKSHNYPGASSVGDTSAHVTNLTMLTPQHSASTKRKRGKRLRMCCPFCNSEFSTKRDLNMHLETEHETTMKLRCHVCQKMFKTRVGLKLHMDVHTGNWAHQCDVCGKKFSQKNHFIGHMNRHAGAKPFQCQVCLKCFTYPQHLTNHKKLCAG